MNKYNLQVGDKIEILSVWEVREITEEGIKLKGPILYPWKHINEALDDGTWKIEERAPSTEYKVGDIVTDDNGKNLYKIRSIEGDTIHVKGEWHSLGLNRRLATPEEIKQYNMKEKKIFGYKFKEEYKHLEAAACKIAFANTAYANETTFAAVPGWDDKNTNFSISSGSYIKLKAAGVLDLWFEPVYKAQETVLKLGDKKIEIKIGQKSILADGKVISREHVSEIVSIMEGDLSINFPWPVQFPTVKIGCTTFTQDEVEKILFTYDDLNP